MDELPTNPQRPALKSAVATTEPHLVRSSLIGRAWARATGAAREYRRPNGLCTRRTPAAVDFNPDEDFEDAFFTGIQSTGTTMWVTVSLEPATYVLLCFFPDIGDGMPHVYHGMFEIVEVGA